MSETITVHMLSCVEPPDEYFFVIQNKLYLIIKTYIYLFIYLGFYVAFNTVQVISRRVVGRAEETSTYSSLGFCIVNCRPTASNYQLSHLRPCGDRTPASEVGGESVTTLPPWPHIKTYNPHAWLFHYTF